MKNFFGKVDTKTVVATALGAALFFVLFAFVAVPSPVPNTSIQLAYGVSAFFGCLFGPLSSLLIAFIGHALNDFILYGSPWWSWIIASGVCGLIQGVAYHKTKIGEGVFDKNTVIQIVLWNVVACLVAFALVAPVLDIVIYAEPAGEVFAQGALSFVADAITAVVVCLLLGKAYSATRTKSGSLDKE